MPITHSSTLQLSHKGHNLACCLISTTSLNKTNICLKYKIGILKRQENIYFPYLSKALYSHSRIRNIIHNFAHKLLKRQHNVTDIHYLYKMMKHTTPISSNMLQLTIFQPLLHKHYKNTTKFLKKTYRFILILKLPCSSIRHVSRYRVVILANLMHINFTTHAVVPRV